jgi:hypothetical protein
MPATRTAAVLAEKLARSPLGAAGALPGTGHTRSTALPAGCSATDCPAASSRWTSMVGGPTECPSATRLAPYGSRLRWECVLQGQPRASTTHRQLDDTALAAAGIARGRFGCRWVWRIQRICWQICVKHSTPSDVCSGPESPWAQDRLRPGKSNAECAPANSGLVGGAAEEITCRGVPTH